MKLLSKNKDTPTDVVAIDTSSRVETDESAHARLGWWIVVAGFGGFLIWAFFAPLDKGVPLSGTVAVSTNRKVVQHPTGGIIEDILVKAGDSVKAGQTLVTMNDTQTKALVEMSRVQYFSALAVAARLAAEQEDRRAITFPAELKNASDDPRVAANISLQNKLFSSRRAAIQSELRNLKEQLDNMRDLAREGYVPRNRMLDLERTYFQRQQEYQREVRTQLSDVQKEAETLKSRLISLEFDLANVEVKAPVDGTVVGINVFTRGGVITPGFKLMEVVPSDDSLVIDGEVPVHLIDKVHAGLPVNLIFSAFNQNKTPQIPGIVTHVSADRQTDERTGMPYYLVKAEVTPEGVKLLEKLQVRAGMPVEIFIKTGERSLISYIFKPILDRIDTSLSEE